MSFRSGHIYFHSSCFDGIASAVLAWDFLEARRFWSTVTLHAVNYELRNRWLSSTLEKPCAVVDFLYHPDTDLWADHHDTAFLGEDAKRDYRDRKNENLIYDAHAGSCAGLLWNYLENKFNYRNPHYKELVEWAEKIDSARYSSVDEAILSFEPALRINLGFALGNGKEYYEDLVNALRSKSLKEVADNPEVQEKFVTARFFTQEGLERFEKNSSLESDGIVTFRVETKEVIINRYAPYYFYPKARYSAGIIRSDHGSYILIMRNPWLNFESMPLGKICEKFGGGGHQRVGAVGFNEDTMKQDETILKQILSELRRVEAESKKGISHGRTF